MNGPVDSAVFFRNLAKSSHHTPELGRGGGGHCCTGSITKRGGLQGGADVRGMTVADVGGMTVAVSKELL